MFLPILPPSTRRKYPLGFFCKISIAFFVMSFREGSPAESFSLSTSNFMSESSNKPIKKELMIFQFLRKQNINKTKFKHIKF